MFYDTTDLRDNEIYLELTKTAEENKKSGYVPAYYFKICRCSDGIEVGQCDLRIGHNHNTAFGGNIGYGIHEFYRGHHYAGKACLLLFDLAKKHCLDYLLISCAPENVASQKTCAYIGAVLMDIINIPKWHEMYKDGRETCL